MRLSPSTGDRRAAACLNDMDLRDRVACHCTADNGSGRPAEGDPGRTGSGASLAGVSSAVRSRVLRDSVGLGLAVGLYGAAFGAVAVAARREIDQPPDGAHWLRPKCVGGA